MRQQFDPRRLEEAAKQRAEAAVQAAAEFSLAAALEAQPVAPDSTDEPTARAPVCPALAGKARQALTCSAPRRSSKRDAGRTTWRKRTNFRST